MTEYEFTKIMDSDYIGASNACNNFQHAQFLIAEKMDSSNIFVTIMVVDFAIFMVSGIVSPYIYHIPIYQETGTAFHYITVSGFAAGLGVQSLNFARAYSIDHLGRLQHQLYMAVGAWTIVILIVLVVIYILKADALSSFNWTILWFDLTLIGLYSWRLVFRRIAGALKQRCLFYQRVAIVGDPAAVKTVLPLVVEGSADLSAEPNGSMPTITAGLYTVEEVTRIKQAVAQHNANRVLVTTSSTQAKEDYSLGPLLDALRELPVEVCLHTVLPIALPRRHYEITTIGQLRVMRVWKYPLNGWQMLVKEAFDQISATLLLLILLPWFLFISLAIKLDSPGPILFRQKRYGLSNCHFIINKFRTMKVEAQDFTGENRTQRNDPRVTRIGAFLRRTSIDELPQLINVLRGEMSLVGPRAHPVNMKVLDQFYHEAVEFYTARHRVKPGITGLAQVNGFRGEVDTLYKAQRRIEYDLQYIENWSLMLDIRILVRTALRILKDENAF